MTAAPAGSAPALVLGPLLRYVSHSDATIWVETDRSCEVEILGRTASTFAVAGHHYALVLIDGLEPGREHEYQVTLDGTAVWPLAGTGFPPSTLRTLSPGDDGRPLRLAFGSCRVTATHQPAREKARDRQQGIAATDALAACAAGLPGTPRDTWPDVLLMIGDQIYADSPGPVARRFIRERRDPSVGPGGGAADFEEYRAVYREAWTGPAVRWLLSVIPTAMIFDDHDLHDDWNISAAWRQEVAAQPWWPARMEGAYLSYWLYQHLGNLSPAELETDETWRRVRERSVDAAPVLRDLAHRSDKRTASIRWSFHRTFGRVRVVMIDSRSRRVLTPGQRRMTDEEEWQWVTDSVRGDWDHVVLATSVPLLLPNGIYALEAWSEAVCDGAWGRHAARFAERLRRTVDLEHWPSFSRSFAQFERLLTGLAAGEYRERGEAPASVTVISGDVHHSYLTAVDLPAGVNSGTAVNQVVSSPFHQWMPPYLRRAQRLGASRPGGVLGLAVARLAGVHRPSLRWRVTQGPWFENMFSVLEFSQRQARVTFSRVTTAPAAPTAPSETTGLTASSETTGPTASSETTGTISTTDPSRPIGPTGPSRLTILHETRLS